MRAKPNTELTPRERQILELLEQGVRNKEIAERLGISGGTLKIHIAHIYPKKGLAGGWKARRSLSQPR